MTRTPEIPLLGLSLVAALISGVWFSFFAAPPADLGTKLPAASVTRNLRRIQKPNTWEPKLSLWLPPPAQSRSARWVYDTFTPPEIFYDAAVHQFTVSPPITEFGLKAETATDSPDLSELRLIKVKRPLFRLQLIGFVKSADEDIGLFENVDTAEIFLARKGRSLPELQLEIKEFEVTTSPISLPESMTSFQTFARAVVRDPQTGEIIALSSAERKLSSHSQATLMVRALAGNPREVSEGDVFEVGDITYEVGEILISPPTIALTRRSPANGVIERRILRAVESDSTTALSPSI